MTAPAVWERLSFTPTAHFKVSINTLWPGQKLKSEAEGETRWGKHTGAWRTESHTPESLCRRVTGDGAAFCAVLKQPWRKSSNFESAQALATDNDGASLETLAAIPLVEDHAAFIYESPSSTPDRPKARVVFVLDSPITDPGMCRLAYRALIWHFSNGAPDEAADEACKDCCRFFYGRPKAPHMFLGNVLYKDILQEEVIEPYLASGAGANLDTPAYTRTGEYDPHRGPQLADEDQLSLLKFLKGLGLKRVVDGRFNGPCIFHDCECPGALYVSLITGSYYCFCSDHPGSSHGSVADLETAGFAPEHAREVMTWEEIEAAVAANPALINVVEHDPGAEAYYLDGSDSPRQRFLLPTDRGALGKLRNRLEPIWLKNRILQGDQIGHDRALHCRELPARRGAKCGVIQCDGDRVRSTCKQRLHPLCMGALARKPLRKKQELIEMESDLTIYIASLGSYDIGPDSLHPAGTARGVLDQVYKWVNRLAKLKDCPNAVKTSFSGVRADLHQGYLTLDLVLLGPASFGAAAYLRDYFQQATERDVEVEVISCRNTETTISTFGNLMSSMAIYGDVDECQTLMDAFKGRRIVQPRGRFMKHPVQAETPDVF